MREDLDVIRGQFVSATLDFGGQSIFMDAGRVVVLDAGAAAN